tara:strand:+ start:60 stop:470 length:411 start_codon:yes stop_codon:yes gene_type:complete
MPFEFNEHDKGIYIRYFDFVAPSDLFASRDVIRALPNHDKFEFALCDFMDMDTDCVWAMTPEIAEAVGRRNIESPGNLATLRKLALVSSSQKILELLQFYAEKHKSAPNAEARLFRSLRPAWAWVGNDGLSDNFSD